MGSSLAAMCDSPRSGERALTVLVAEDEPMISTSLSDDLEEAGYRVAGPFRRGADALDWLDRNRADLAMLDLVLRDGMCVSLAEALRAKQIPFLVFSGYFRGPDVPPIFRDAPWVEKPGAFDDILAALAAMAER